MIIELMPLLVDGQSVLMDQVHLLHLFSSYLTGYQMLVPMVVQLHSPLYLEGETSICLSCWPFLWPRSSITIIP